MGLTGIARDAAQTAPGAFAAAAVNLLCRGLFPIPVGGRDGKVPMIRYFTTMRRPGPATLHKWIARWPIQNVGIVTGPISKITVVDIDGDDPGLLREIERRFGETPIAIRTPSGGVHLYFRFAAERCANLRPALPVDIKAAGGFVVCPPSVRPSGEHIRTGYVFIRGSLDDLAHLPAITPGSLPARTKTAATATITPSTRTKVVQLGAVGVGYRNDVLFGAALRRARTSTSEQALLAAGIEINAAFIVPLEFTEVAKTVHSAWGYEVRGENWVGTRDRAAAAAFQNVALAARPDAETLLLVLRHAHGARDTRGEPFAASPRAMAAARVIRSWGASHQRYSRALAALVEFDFLDIVHMGGRRPGDARLFRFHHGGLSMRPRLVVSNNSSTTVDADLIRVVDALKSGLSIRKTGEALGMDKSKVLRLKHRAEASGLLGEADQAVSHPPEAVSHPPDQVSHFTPPLPSEGVSHSTGPNERKKRTPPPPPPPPAGVEGKSETGGIGCLLNVPDGKGSHRPCGRPVGADRIFCAEHR